jgi:uncharacterized protein
MASPRGSQTGCVTLVVVAALLMIGGRTIASWVLDFHWWREMGQVDTWLSMLGYAVSPAVLVAALAFIIFWMAHARGMKSAGVRLRDYPSYARLSTLGLLLVATIFSAAVVNSWTVVRFFGGQGAVADAWRDPTFAKPLTFYLFDLPFYVMLLRGVLALCVVGALIYYVAARGWTMATNMPKMRGEFELELPDLAALTNRELRFLMTLGGVFLLAMAVSLYLDRYQLLLSEHTFMVGVDWVHEKLTIPLLWANAAACIIAAVLLWTGKWRMAVAVLGIAIVARFAVPRVAGGVYVRPNELAIQREYIRRHIEGTRQAFGLNTRTTQRDFNARPESKIDFEKNRAALDNVRLWDWRAFHDTVSQIQPLRPYIYSDTDVDRYMIDGQLRQVMLSPRELDLNQLGDARARWTNPHLVYTHGYGLVMAEANRITANGLPVLFIESAPPEIHTESLKLTRPELYYGEVVHEPVFVRTQQPEFNYPSGSENVHMQYDGKGGFPIYSLPLRFAAALVYGDWNILLTGQLNAESRMMINRKITERLSKLAGFVHWERDPYLVLTDEGRSVWIIDGYLTTDSHPYSRPLSVQGIGNINYIRNSVKATIDAYDGTTRLYVFDPSDPLVSAYRRLFPRMFTDASEMPADLRAHVRYPETIFRVQAEVYRMFHMRDPESFYNRSDQWDIARSLQGQDMAPGPMPPTYVIATLPGEDSPPEFLLLIPFTPRNKDNLIGFMAARCDGPNLGEIVVLQLSKQEVLLGPMQVEARINQDQNISKDLSLWNQQGSQVLRGQMLVLPIDDTFIYVEPIYIQAREARMPQLKKVVVAMGNNLIYMDTYEQALAELARIIGSPAPRLQTQTQAQPAAPPEAPTAGAVTPTATAVPAAAGRDTRLDTIRDHLRRYREFSSQGRWSEAGRELEAVEGLVRR